MELKKLKVPQAIEELVFQVAPEFIDKFISLDHEIWTKMLAGYDGFIRKETWVNDMNKGEITTIIYWETLEKWKIIPENELAKTQIEFDAAMGKDNYKFIAAHHEGNQKYLVTIYE